jgi:hypothetical protein
MLNLGSVLALCTSLAGAPPTAPSPDTLRVEVGSPAVNGRVYAPHAARVRVRVGSEMTAEWTNHLTIGDSAGRPVMRWVTRGTRKLPGGGTGSWELYQTYDQETMAPLSYRLSSQAGMQVQLTIEGRRVRGTRKTPADSLAQAVDLTLTRAGFIASASDLVPLAVGLREGLVIIAPVWGPAMVDSELRAFSVLGRTTVDVEGTGVEAWKVEERTLSDHRLTGIWYLVNRAPYMVAGEVPLPDGTMQWMTEVSIPDR